MSVGTVDKQLNDSVSSKDGQDAVMAPEVHDAWAAARAESEEDTAGEEPVEEAGEDAGDEPDVTEPAQDADPKDGDGGGTEAAWVTAGDKVVAESYGLTDEDLATFGSRAAFERVTAALDKQRSAPPAPPAETKLDKQQDEEPLGEIPLLDEKAYEDANYDEQTLALVRSHNALVERLNALAPKVGEAEKFSQTLQQAQSQAEQAKAWDTFAETFDKWADTRDESVYGRLPERGTVEYKLRERVILEADSLRDLYRQRGQAVPSEDALFAKAEVLALGKPAEAKSTVKKEAVAAQAKRKRPSPSMARAKGKGSEGSVPPAVHKLWKQYQEENGAI